MTISLQRPRRTRTTRAFTLLEVLVSAAVLLGLAVLLTMAGGGALHSVSLAGSHVREWDRVGVFRQRLQADLDAAPMLFVARGRRAGYACHGDPDRWILTLAAPARKDETGVRHEIVYEWTRATGLLTRSTTAKTGEVPESRIILMDGVTGFGCEELQPPRSRANGRANGRTSEDGIPAALRFTLESLVAPAPVASAGATAPRRSLEILVALRMPHVD
jgi:hypothetical protein